MFNKLFILLFCLIIIEQSIGCSCDGNSEIVEEISRRLNVKILNWKTGNVTDRKVKDLRKYELKIRDTITKKVEKLRVEILYFENSGNLVIRSVERVTETSNGLATSLPNTKDKNQQKIELSSLALATKGIIKPLDNLWFDKEIGKITSKAIKLQAKKEFKGMKKGFKGKKKNKELFLELLNPDEITEEYLNLKESQSLNKEHELNSKYKKPYLDNKKPKKKEPKLNLKNPKKKKKKKPKKNKEHKLNIKKPQINLKNSEKNKEDDADLIRDVINLHGFGVADSLDLEIYNKSSQQETKMPQENLALHQ